MAGPRIFWLTSSDRMVSSSGERSALFPGEELSVHLTRSLRCQKGDRFSFCEPDSGRIFAGEVAGLSPLSLELVLLEKAQSSPEESSRCRFSMAIAPIKGDFLSQTLSQAAMCGIDRLIWLSTDRGVVKWDAEEFSRKKGRMEAVIREKSQLAGRTSRMSLESPVTLPELAMAPDRSFLFFDEAASSWISEKPWWEDVLSEFAGKAGNRELVGLIGPEGGWSDRERDFLKSLPKDRVFSGTLGPLILSAEAAILSVISFLGIAGGYYRHSSLNRG